MLSPRLSRWNSCVVQRAKKTADAHGIFVPFLRADTHAGVTQDVVFSVTDTGSHIRYHPAGTSMWCLHIFIMYMTVIPPHKCLKRCRVL